MERREFLALAITLPLTISDEGNSRVCLNQIRFIGDFGRQVEQELRVQLSNQWSFIGNLLGSNTQFHKPHAAVVSEISDPELLAFIESMKSSKEIGHCFAGYFAANFQTGNAAAKEDIGRRFRLIHEVFPQVRIFTDLDYQEPKALPQWPLEWTNNRLTTEQKQIVWELLRNACPASLKFTATHHLSG